MASTGFDTRALRAYGRDLQRAANEYPKQEKKFLRKEGSKLLRKTKKNAKSKVKKRTGKYHKSIKRGKVYTYHGAQAVRVYSAAPHGHLIEDGYRQVLPNGQELGFTPGLHIFEESRRDFEPEFLNDADDMLDDLTRLL